MPLLLDIAFTSTGWCGGGAADTERISLKHTRAIISAIHTGRLAAAPTEQEPVFGLNIVTECEGVPSGILIPRSAWANPDAYDKAAARLATLFVENFKAYSNGVDQNVIDAGPTS